MPRWTDETRAQQSERMKQLKPWLKTTGPNTEEGKKTSSQNAMRHGMRSELAKTLRRTLKEQAEILKGL